MTRNTRREGRMIARATLVLFAIAALAAPAFAQSSSDAMPANDAQMNGHRLFVQSCAVCHLKPSPTAKTYGPSLTPDLVKGHEDAIAQIIRDGSTRMPGFKYDLQPGEIAAIVGYLAGAPDSAPAPVAATQPQSARGEAYLSGTV